jgi:hypothetical protein
MINWNKAKLLNMWGHGWYEKNLLSEIENGEMPTIIIINPQEYMDFKESAIFGGVDFANNIDNSLIKNNKMLYLFIGNEISPKYNLLHRNIRQIYWDSIDFFSKFTNFYLKNDISFISVHDLYIGHENDGLHKILSVPKKHFTSMINLQRTWRHYIVNQIFKNDLYKYGEYAFRIKKIKEIKDFDSWIPTDIRLDDDVNNDKLIDQNIIPDKYLESAFDIVVETLNDSFFITEKTLRPIITKKPFIVFSCENFHYKLQNYGFKLYDEIINYDFDRILDSKKRFDAQILELKRLKDIYTPEEIYHITKEKTIFNYNKLLEYKYKKTPDYIPDEIWNFENEHFYMISGKDKIYCN